jgi:hypothetical protein
MFERNMGRVAAVACFLPRFNTVPQAAARGFVGRALRATVAL